MQARTLVLASLAAVVATTVAGPAFGATSFDCCGDVWYTKGS